MKVIYLGLDCDAPPDYAEVAARGYRWVGRYLPPHDNPLTRAEMQEAALHDVGILALCEHSTNDVNGGAAQGRTLAEQWVKSAQGLSIALGAALILACDEDPSSVPKDVASAFYSASTSYCRGARYLGGAYGGHDLMVLLSGHVDVLMQSYAWSGGVQAPGIDVFQGLSQVTIDGVAFDEDHAFCEHFGAFNSDGLWPHVAPPAPKPAPPAPPKPAPQEDDVTTIDVPLGIGDNGQGTYTTTVPFADVLAVTALFGEGPNPGGSLGIANAGGKAVVVGKGWAKGAITVRVAYSAG